MTAIAERAQTRRRRPTKGAEKTTRYVVLALASVVALFPVFWALSTALRPSTELFSQPVQLLPSTFTLDAFVQVLTQTPTLRYIGNSLLIVTCSTAIGLVFSTLAAYGLSRFNFRGKGSFLTFLLVTQMFPAIMLLIPYFQIISSVGLYNTYAAIIITYVAFAIPFCSWVLYGFMKTIPRDLDEAAMIDGCTPFGAFRRVILPLATPGIIATAIFSFITGWNEYLFALALLQSENLRTMPVGIGLLAGNDTVDYNVLMAASVLAVIPMVIIFIFFQRHLVSGLGAGAVKG